MATFTGTGIVWNPDKNNILCNLNKGSFTTIDEREQSIMRNAGFIGDYEDEYPIIEDDAEDAIRLVAKRLCNNCTDRR